MDLDDQASIKQVVDRVGSDDLVVLLGSPNAESAELYAATVTMGDPTYAGPLAGIPLGLPVYHIFEDAVRSQVKPAVYEEQVGLLELALDTDAVRQTMETLRVPAR